MCYVFCLKSVNHKCIPKNSPQDAIEIQLGLNVNFWISVA